MVSNIGCLLQESFSDLKRIEQIKRRSVITSGNHTHIHFKCYTRKLMFHFALINRHTFDDNKFKCSTFFSKFITPTILLEKLKDQWLIKQVFVKNIV